MLLILVVEVSPSKFLGENGKPSDENRNPEGENSLLTLDRDSVGRAGGKGAREGGGEGSAYSPLGERLERIGIFGCSCFLDFVTL